MKRMRICFFLCILCIGICMASYFLWSGIQLPISIAKNNLNVQEQPAVAASSGNIRIKPGTKLVLETYDVKNNSLKKIQLNMPQVYLGMDREDLELYLAEQLSDQSIDELLEGLLRYDVMSYSADTVTIRKTCLLDDDYQKYYMVYHQGRVVVYYSDKKTVYDYPNIHLESLPEEVQKEIFSGKSIKDDEELYGVLQNYSS